MGQAMARNLRDAGLQVRAWNRTREKADPLAGDGITVTDRAAEAADGADIVLTMLADADAVVSAMEGPDGALAGMDGAVWLQTSTIGIAGTERCAALAGDAGVTLVDAPVLGTRQPAEQGQLIVLASGPDTARDRVQPALDAIGKRTLWVGETGAGTRLKLVTNAWLLAVVEGAAEAIALAEGLDLEPSLLMDAVEGGPLDLPYLRMKGEAIMQRDFAPSFRLALAAKDARLVGEAAERHGLQLALVDVVRRQMESVAGEHGDEDMSATYWATAKG